MCVRIPKVKRTTIVPCCPDALASIFDQIIVSYLGLDPRPRGGEVGARSEMVRCRALLADAAM